MNFVNDLVCLSVMEIDGFLLSVQKKNGKNAPTTTTTTTKGVLYFISKTKEKNEQ